MGDCHLAHRSPGQLPAWYRIRGGRRRHQKWQRSVGVSWKSRLAAGRILTLERMAGSGELPVTLETIGHREADFRLRAPDSGLRTPDSGLRTPDSGLRTPDSQRV